MSQALRDLALRVGLGIAGAVVVVLADTFVNLRFNPALSVLVGAVGGALVWAVGLLQVPARPHWVQPSFHRRSVLLRADVRTRRLAHALGNAQPGKGFDAGRVARQLAEMTGRRLVATGRVPADDPLRHADDHLSPRLLAYLRSADDQRAPALTRKALHAHLKEIDSL